MITVVKSYMDNDGLRSQKKPYLAKGYVTGEDDDAMKIVGVIEPILTVYSKVDPKLTKP